MTTHTSRRLSLRWLGLLLLPTTLMLLPATPVEAHQQSYSTPRGRSPFYSPYQWRNTGSWFGQGTHVDYTSTGVHNNAHYAVDLTTVGAPALCDRNLYPIWDNLRVTYMNRTTGWLIMEGNPTGSGTYRLQYRHMNIRLSLNQGDSVPKSTAVGTVGQRGNTDNCHLHMETHAKYGATDYRSRRTNVCGHMIADETTYSGCSS